MANRTYELLCRFQVTLDTVLIVPWQGQDMQQIIIEILFFSDEIHVQQSNRNETKSKNQKSILMTQKNLMKQIPLLTAMEFYYKFVKLIFGGSLSYVTERDLVGGPTNGDTLGEAVISDLRN